MRRSAYALLIGLLLLTTLRVDEPPAGPGDQAHATLTAARTHGTPVTPLVGLLAVAAGLAAVRLWRSLVAATPSLAWATAPLPIRRRGPPVLPS